MKIGVLSDTHIPLVAPCIPEEVLDCFLKEEVKVILHAGDLVILDVLDDLLSLAPVRAVSGNMDTPPVREKFPIKEIINVEGAGLGLIHGWGSPHGLPERIKREFDKDEVQCIIFGHSHQPYMREVEGTLLFNPGTPTDRRYSSVRSLGILEVEGGCVRGRHLFLR